MAETNYTPVLGEFIEVTSSGGPFPLYSFPGAPSGTYPEGAIGFDESTGDVYQVVSGSWVLLFSTGGGGGGTTIQFSAASDPSGVPTGNARVWFREDLGKMWLYNTTTSTWDAIL